MLTFARQVAEASRRLRSGDCLQGSVHSTTTTRPANGSDHRRRCLMIRGRPGFVARRAKQPQREFPVPLVTREAEYPPPPPV
ncbi:unnamed protein product [Lampetra fluviatilis]